MCDSRGTLRDNACAVVSRALACCVSQPLLSMCARRGAAAHASRPSYACCRGNHASSGFMCNYTLLWPSLGRCVALNGTSLVLLRACLTHTPGTCQTPDRPFNSIASMSDSDWKKTTDIVPWNVSIYKNMFDFYFILFIYFLLRYYFQKREQLSGEVNDCNNINLLSYDQTDIIT